MKRDWGRPEKPKVRLEALRCDVNERDAWVGRGLRGGDGDEGAGSARGRVTVVGFLEGREG